MEELTEESVEKSIKDKIKNRPIYKKELTKFLNRKKVKSDHTRKNYENCIGQLLEKHNIQTIQDYDKLTLEDFEDHLDSLPVKDSSYNQHLRSIKAFGTYLFEHDKIKEDIVKNIPRIVPSDKSGDEKYDEKRMAKKKLYLTDEEIQKMIAVSKGINAKLAIALLGYMGVRREELIHLKVSDIKKYGDLGISGKGLTYKERRMPPIVKFLIEEYLKDKKNDSEYLIVSKVGNHQIKNAHSIYERIKSAGRKAGIDPEKMKFVTPHTMRRSMCCNAALRGVPVPIIQEMARHEKPETTAIYLEALKGSKAVDDAFDNTPMPDMSILVS
jgi:integrase